MNVIELLEGLKNKKIDWVVFGDKSTIRFNAAIKEVSEDNYLRDGLLIKFKGAKGILDYLRLDGFFTYEKEETDRSLIYKIHSEDKKMRVLFGYFKGGDNK
jgi:predicted nucleotidyltransferase